MIQTLIQNFNVEYNSGYFSRHMILASVFSKWQHNNIIPQNMSILVKTSALASVSYKDGFCNQYSNIISLKNPFSSLLKLD